jgi:hypothetical protein
MCLTNSRNIDLLACRAIHGRAFTGHLATLLQAFRFRRIRKTITFREKRK